MAQFAMRSNGAFGKYIETLVKDWEGGKALRWGLMIAGHSYWWALEYGTGGRFGKAAGPVVLDDEGNLTVKTPYAEFEFMKKRKMTMRPDGTLQQPSAPFPHRDSFKPATYGVGRAYPIWAGQARMVGGKFAARYGHSRVAGRARGAKRLNFYSHGDWHFGTKVQHPGAFPRGMVRRAYMRFKTSVMSDIKDHTQRGILARSELVDIVNENLKTMLATLQQLTPHNTDVSPYHEEFGFPKKYRTHAPLQDSWRMIYAE